MEAGDAPQELDPTESTENQGYLAESLNRSNAQIRKDRGQVISEDLEVEYKRRVEDIQRDISRKQRDQKNLFDFSPDSAQSLVLAKNVEAMDILEADNKLALEIREMKIKLNIAVERYNFLFGETFQTVKID